MRALEYDRYGPADVAVVRDVERPRPRAGEVLVRVRAAGLNPKDVLTRKGKFAFVTGRKFPKRIGLDFAGEIAEDAEGFRAGERVWGFLNQLRAIRGTAAEYVVVKTREVGRIPASLSFEDAAALPLAACTSLQALRDLGGVTKGTTVCVSGASGGVGTAALQIARALGARVTSLSSAANLELCRSLGADEALDYAKDDPFAGGRRWDVFYDVFGNRRFSTVRAGLAPRGRYITTVPSPRNFFDHARTAFSAKKSRLVLVRASRPDLDALASMVETGALKPVVERVYPLAAAVEAMRRLETRRTRGKLVLRVG